MVTLLVFAEDRFTVSVRQHAFANNVAGSRFRPVASGFYLSSREILEAPSSESLFQNKDEARKLGLERNLLPEKTGKDA